MRHYVRDRRVRRAESLLAGGMKVQAVALCVGFDSRNTLYRLVRARTGLTPRRMYGQIKS